MSNIDYLREEYNRLERIRAYLQSTWEDSSNFNTRYNSVSSKMLDKRNELVEALSELPNVPVRFEYEDGQYWMVVDIAEYPAQWVSNEMWTAYQSFRQEQSCWYSVIDQMDSDDCE